MVEIIKIYKTLSKCRGRMKLTFKRYVSDPDDYKDKGDGLNQTAKQLT